MIDDITGAKIPAGNPFDVVRQFEKELCDYTGAPYCVTVTSCTAALLLAVAWCLRGNSDAGLDDGSGYIHSGRPDVEIPKRTYIGVPMSIVHAGGRPTFRSDDWSGMYQLRPLPVWDSARLLTSDMYVSDRPPGQFVCLSFHHAKHLGLAAHGGAILHDSPEADAWLRRARFDGRTEGVAPKDDKFTQIGFHCYMTPPTAAEGLMRLASLPRHNDPLRNDDYADLSLLDIFK